MRYRVATEWGWLGILEQGSERKMRRDALGISWGERSTTLRFSAMEPGGKPPDLIRDVSVR